MKASESAHKRVLHEAQVVAWRDCYEVLTHSLPAVQRAHPELAILFEYELPYEAGRRPDVILLSQEYVVILEFKRKRTILRADIDQAAAYARDIQEYHLESRERKVLPFLVVTQMHRTTQRCGNVIARSGDCLEEALLSALAHETSRVMLLPGWIPSMSLSPQL